MKKKLVLGLVSVALIAAACVFGYVVSLPEYALQKMVNEMQEEGIEALEAHLIDDALKKYQSILAIWNNPLLRLLVNSQENDLENLLTAVDFDCQLQSVQRVGSSAELSLNITGGNLNAQVTLSMIRQGSDWFVRDAAIGSLGLSVHTGGMNHV